MSPSFGKKYTTKPGDQSEPLIYELYAYGSSQNGLATNTSSDLDLTIVIPDLQISHQKVLEDIVLVLQRKAEGRYVYHKKHVLK